MESEWPMGLIPITAKELKELQDKADKLEAVKNLMSKWEDDMKGYPDTVKGLHARAAVNLCRKEVEEILEAEG